MIMDNGSRIVKLALGHANGYVLAQRGHYTSDPNKDTCEYVVWRVEREGERLYAFNGSYFRSTDFDGAAALFRERVAGLF